jgi:hypothetical protein
MKLGLRNKILWETGKNTYKAGHQNKKSFRFFLIQCRISTSKRRTLIFKISLVTQIKEYFHKLVKILRSRETEFKMKAVVLITHKLNHTLKEFSNPNYFKRKTLNLFLETNIKIQFNLKKMIMKNKFKSKT